MYYWGRLDPDYQPHEPARLYRVHGGPGTATNDHVWLERPRLDRGARLPAALHLAG